MAEQARASLRQCLFELRTAAPGLVEADATWVWLTDAKLVACQPGPAAAPLDRLTGLDPAFDLWLAERRIIAPSLPAHPLTSLQEKASVSAVLHPRRLWGVVAVPLAVAAVWALRGQRELSDAVGPPVIAIAQFSAVPATPVAVAVAEQMADDVRAMLPPGRAIVRLTSGTADSREIARQLRAQWVITGSADVRGDGRLVRARIENADGGLLWAREFDAAHGSIADTAAIAATRIGATTGCALRGPQFRSDPRVLGLFFDACDRADCSGDDYNHQQALLAAQRLAQAAPDDALAQAFLGARLAMTVEGLPKAIAKAQVDMAKRYLDRAQRLDPRVGETWLGRFALVDDDRAWTVKESMLAHGLAVEPDNALLNQFMAELLANVGRTEESLVFAHRARAIAPADLTAAQALVGILSASDRPRAAVVVLDTIDRHFPRNARQAMQRLDASFDSGDTAGARLVLDRARDIPNSLNRQMRQCVAA